MAVRRILTLITSGTIMVSAASASPRSDPTVGRAVFTGATLPSATSLTLNPAAVGLDPVTSVSSRAPGDSSGKVEIYFAGIATLAQLGIDRRLLDVDTGTFRDGPHLRDDELGPGGDAAILWHYNDRLTLGGALRLPPPEMFPKDRAPLRYHTLGGSERTYDATVGVSLRVTSALFVGASLTHENTYLRLKYARDTALEAGSSDVENFQHDELYDVAVHSPIFATSNLRVSVGSVFRIATDVWIGVAYHTPPGFDIQTPLDGTLDVTRAPADGGGVIHGNSTVNMQYPASLDAEIRARLPMDLDFHLGGRWEDLSRMSAYDVRAYNSTFRANGIPEQMLRARGLHDSFAVWTGVEQVESTERSLVQLGARIGYETSSVSDAKLSPQTIAPAAITADVGAQVRVGQWKMQLSYGIAYSPTIQVQTSAYDPRYRLDCIDSGYDYTTKACQATRDGYALPTAAGNYQRIDHAVRLGFRYEY